MSNYLNYDGSHNQELNIVRDLTSKLVSDIVAHVTEAENTPPFADRLHTLIAEKCDHHQANGILRHVFWIGSICSLEAKNPNDVVKDISGELKRLNWETDEIQKWETAATTLCSIVQRTEFVAARKAIELSYDYANIFNRAKLLTDIRPVFSDNGEEIISSVISYCLRLNYQNGTDYKELALVLDDREVTALRDQCERALEKSQKAADLMSTKADIPSSIAGKRDN